MNLISIEFSLADHFFQLDEHLVLSGNTRNNTFYSRAIFKHIDGKWTPQRYLKENNIFNNQAQKILKDFWLRFCSITAKEGWGNNLDKDYCFQTTKEAHEFFLSKEDGLSFLDESICTFFYCLNLFFCLRSKDTSYDDLEDEVFIPWVLASYVSYYPFIAFNIDYKVEFNHFIELGEWEHKLYSELLKNDQLSDYFEAIRFVQFIITTVNELDRANIEIHELERKLAHETAWKNDGDNLPAELLVAHMVWNEKYRDNKLPHHSHSSAVETIIKRNDFLPQNDRLIDRINRITTPLKLKSDPKWKDIFKFENN